MLMVRLCSRLDKEKYPDEPGLEATGERATYTKNGEKARKHYAGSSIPDVYGGFSTNFRYKDIGLNFVFAYQIGGKSYDGLYQSMMSRDLTSGTACTLTSIVLGASLGRSLRPSPRLQTHTNFSDDDL